MIDRKLLTAAVKIGQLSAEVPSPSVIAAALEEMRVVIPCDAASVVLFDQGQRTTAASFGYNDHLADSFARIFPATPWFRYVMDRELPPSISTEPGDAFRRDWFFENYLAPAGIRDGMGSALVRHERLLGTINLSSSEDIYDETYRTSLDVITTALSRLVDTMGRLGDLPVWQDDPPPLALLRDREMRGIPGTQLPDLLTDPELLDVLTSELDGARRIEFIWSTATEWWQIVVEPVHIPAFGEGLTWVVRARPTASPHGLSHREVEVLTCLALGMTNDAIAKTLVVSTRTVHSHVEHILHKTGSTSRGKAAALAWRERCLVPRMRLGGVEALTGTAVLG